MRPHGSRDRAPIPSEPDPARGSPALGAGGVWVAAAAAAAGVGSAYWDDSWHTTLGRDSTFIPPHLLLYASILTVGVVIAGWGWRRLAATRSVAAVFRTPGFALAVAAAVATAAAAPADAFWHTAFGRDAVLWSPPAPAVGDRHPVRADRPAHRHRPARARPAADRPGRRRAGGGADHRDGIRHRRAPVHRDPVPAAAAGDHARRGMGDHHPGPRPHPPCPRRRRVPGVPGGAVGAAHHLWVARPRPAGRGGRWPPSP